VLLKAAVAESAAARLTRQSGTNFYYAFRVLPFDKRQAIYAVYSFCRVLDDCVDEESGEGAAGLARWTQELQRCYGGTPETELGRDLTAALSRFPIPRSCFEDIVAGCRMDLEVRRYARFDELRLYCERVASAVGLACIEIFGYSQPQARAYAVELGVALQLTNILRDVATDAARDRLYLPAEDLERFGVSEDQLMKGAARTPAVDALLAFEGARAREQFARAAALLPRPDRRRLASAEIMAAIYRGLLEELARRGYPLAGPRVQLSKARKLWLALGACVRTLLR